MQLANALKTGEVALVGTRRSLGRGLPKCTHARIQRVRDDVICLAGRVLVDDRRVHAVVSHPRHEITRAYPGCRREGVAGVPKIVKVEPGRADGLEQPQASSPEG